MSDSAKKNMPDRRNEDFYEVLLLLIKKYVTISCVNKVCFENVFILLVCPDYILVTDGHYKVAIPIKHIVSVRFK